MTATKAWLRTAVLLCLGLMLAVRQVPAADSKAAFSKPTIGVFYFPGWKDDLPGHPYPRPWEQIKPYPERKPLLGWYKEGEPDVMRQQLDWMSQYGIDVVIFDWYWNGSNPALDHAIKAYLAVDGSKPKFSVMWANHGGSPKSGTFFYSIGRYWIDNYFSRPDYLKIDGQPVVFIQLGDLLDDRAKAFGSNAEELLSRAQVMAKGAKLPGIFFVSGGGGQWLLKNATGSPKGFSAYFAYNYHAGPGGTVGREHRFSRGYRELDEAYRRHWDWMMDHSNAPYILPLTSGWDKRPWGGSKDPKHDRSISTPEQFQAHVKAAKKVLAAHPDKTLNMATICCWNEFGEGSFIEPTERHRFGYMQTILDTFGR